jgi:2-iminobutanoate/2-iminopropanoate deaminase
MGHATETGEIASRNRSERRRQMVQTEQPQRISTEGEPWAQNCISSGFRVGDLIVTAGQVAVDESGEVIGAGDFDAQIDHVFKRLDEILTAAGAGLKDVIKTNIYVTDVANLSRVIEYRKKYFTAPYPASTLVGVKELVFPDLMVEIEVIAVAPNETR